MRSILAGDRPLVLAAAVGGAGIALWLVLWALTGHVALWPPICDDAHYYLVIARNVTDGNGLTFDGLHDTNGFQPLWLLLLLPVLALTGGGTAALVVLSAVVLGLTAVVVATTFGLLRTAVAVPAAALAVVVLAYPRFLEPLTSGVEAPLALVLALLVARRLLDDEDPGWAVGVLLAAICLTRLDAVFLLVPVTLLVVAPRRSLGVAGRTLGPPIVAVAAYSAWCWVVFGSPVPISGRLKSSLPDVGPWWDTIGEHPEWALLVALSVVVLLTVRSDEPHRRALHRVGTVFVAGAVLHLLWTLFFVDWAVENWHFTTYLPGPLIAVALLADRALARRPAVTWQPAALLLVANLALSTLVLAHATDFVRSSEEVAGWLDANAPAGAVVATRDAGALGYFSEHPVINLDGVVNDEHFAQEVCAGRLDTYLSDNGVTFLVAIVDADSVEPGYGSLQLHYDCHLGARRAAASSIEVQEADQRYATAPLAVDRETLLHLPVDDRLVVWAPTVTIGRLGLRPLLLVALLAGLVLATATALAPDDLEIESSDYQDFYRPVADRLADGHGLTTPDGGAAVRYPPGYPVLLATTSLASDVLPVSRSTLDDVVGGLLFMASAAAFAVVAAALIGVTRGLVATVVWVLWPITVGLAVIRSSDMLFILVSLVATGLAVRILRRPAASTQALLGLGAVAGLAVLVRPTGAALVVGISVAMAVGAPAARRGRRGLLPLAGAALVVLPWVVGASLAAHQFVPVSTGGVPTTVDGLSFGIDPGERGDAPLTPGMRDLMAESERRKPEIFQGGELVTFLGDQVRERPGTVALLVAYKAARSWYGTESLRYEPALLVLALLLVPTAVVGLRRWRRNPDLAPVVVLVAVTVALTWALAILTLSIHRYLAPAAGLLLIPAVDVVTGWFSRSPTPPPPPSAG